MEARSVNPKSDSSQSEQDLLLTHARLIDGSGCGPQKDMSILIRGNRIAEISEMQSAEGADVLDLKGATVMPGIIDAHVHLQSVPGSMYRRDSEPELKEQRRHQLRAYLACGVTTVLDNLIAAPMLRELRGHLDMGGAGPAHFCAGAGFLPSGRLSGSWHAHALLGTALRADR